MTVTERLRARLTPLTVAALALVALQLVVRGWVVSGSYYFQDDFAHLDLARRLGLSGDYLVRDYGGHLEVGQYALIWLVSHLVDTSFAPAAASILLLQAVASALLFQVLRAIFGESPLVLVPFTAYLFTPLGLAWSAWWSAAVQTLPLQIAMLLVLLAMTRLHQGASWRWGVVAVAAHVLGLVFWEKAALVLPTALAVQLLVVSAPAPWRSRVAGLRRAWPVWTAHAVVLVGYVVVYLSVVDSQVSPGGGLGVGRLLDQSLLRMFVPGMLGGPWHAVGAENTAYPYTGTFGAVVFLLLLVGLVVLSTAVSGRRAFEGWALLVGYVAVDLLLLGLARPDWIGLLARDPRYVADALPVLAVAVTAAFRGLLETSPRLPAARWLGARLTLSTALRASALLLVSCLVTTAQLATVVQHEYSENFTLGVASQMEAAPERSVVNGAAPYAVSARADIAEMMNAIGKDVTFDRPATQMYLFDGLGALQPMDLFPGTEVVPGPKEGCGWRVDGDETSLVDAPEDEEPSRILRLGYYSATSATLEVRVGVRLQTLEVPAGTGRAFFVIGPEEGEVSVRAVDADELCVTDVGIGPAWVAP